MYDSQDVADESSLATALGSAAFPAVRLAGEAGSDVGDAQKKVTHSLTAALDQLRVVASSTSSDLGLQSGQHQQIGQCLLPLVAAMFFVDDPADASSQRQEECQCELLLTVAVPSKQVCSPVCDRCDRIMNEEGHQNQI